MKGAPGSLFKQFHLLLSGFIILVCCIGSIFTETIINFLTRIIINFKIQFFSRLVGKFLNNKKIYIFTHTELMDKINHFRLGG